MTAYNLIKRYGWVQHKLGNKDEGFCVLGALITAYPPPAFYLPMRNRLARVLSPNANCFSVANWNNAPKRTKRQVLAALKQAGV